MGCFMDEFMITITHQPSEDRYSTPHNTKMVLDAEKTQVPFNVYGICGVHDLSLSCVKVVCNTWQNTHSVESYRSSSLI